MYSMRGCRLASSSVYTAVLKVRENCRCLEATGAHSTGGRRTRGAHCGVPEVEACDSSSVEGIDEMELARDSRTEGKDGGDADDMIEIVDPGDEESDKCGSSMVVVVVPAEPTLLVKLPQELRRIRR
jgi:hypothetical protein